MGCGKSKAEEPRAPPSQPAADAGGGGGGGGGGKGGKKIQTDSKFQWKDNKGWNNYDKGTDAKLKQAYLIGRNGSKFKLKTHKGEIEEYTFNFSSGHMSQKNVTTGKPRDMRAPFGMDAPPVPLLPENSDFIVITIEKSMVGKKTATVKNPRGGTITVSIPKGAKAGMKMAVPIPAEGETMEDLAKKQKGYSVGKKIAIGTGITVVAGAAVVGGVVLGDHLAGGTLAVDIADFAADVGADIADFAADAGDVIADVAGDVGDGIADVAEDVGEWLGDAAEDVGEWICSVF